MTLLYCNLGHLTNDIIIVDYSITQSQYSLKLYGPTLLNRNISLDLLHLMHFDLLLV